MYQACANNFDQWRQKAREFLAKEIPPAQISWLNDGSKQENLFTELDNLPASDKTYKIPASFIKFAEIISLHRDSKKWNLLYYVLWQITHGNKNLLKISSDLVVRELEVMEKEIRRDSHKMKAFVRFRKTNEDGEEHYIAWHRPDHFVVCYTAPFFMRRFGSMRWTILTPDESVYWDGEELIYFEGVATNEGLEDDKLEDLWRDYYRATFNPARIKLKAMRKEMAVRHWATLPETRIIPDLLKTAPERVAEMIKHQEGIKDSAANYLPEIKTLENLEIAAKDCKGCPLFQKATQTVFGQGPKSARLMLVGEQPGNDEDLSGSPFVGPAGQILDAALEAAGIDRSQLYITNAVKHFKYVQHDNYREHRSPDLNEINACKPWLLSEIEAVKPNVILCLGATAARSLISNIFAVKKHRGAWQQSYYAKNILATYHPSAILRIPDEATKAQIYQYLIDDLRKADERSKAAISNNDEVSDKKEFPGR